MADVSSAFGIGQQIRAIAVLRWQIFRNGLRKKNARADLIGTIISIVVLSFFVLGLCVAFFVGSYNFLSGDHAAWMALLFWGIFLCWQLFPIFVAGFGAGFEFRTLLRFPLRLTSFYIIGLAYGLSDVGAIASLYWLISMALGAALAKPSVLPVLLLVEVAFVWMNVTLERLIGSWLERILARRRSRELFYVLLVALMISSNLVQPIMRRWGGVAHARFTQILPYLAPFPGSLAGRAVAGFTQGHATAALIGLGGIILYALIFTGLLWLRFASQYRGEELSESLAPSPIRAQRSTSGATSSEDALKWFSPQVAAVVRKEFRYLTRNSFVLLQLAIPVFLIFIFSSQFAGKHPVVGHHPLSTDIFFPAIMAYLILILMAPAYNSFAFEGKGIQAYFTAPLKFRDVFLGKNLMLAAVILIELGIALVAFFYMVGTPAAPTLVSTLVALVFVVVGQMVIANWSSLNFPRKLQFGQMRGQRQAGMAVLITFGAQIVFGGISAPIFFIGRWTGNVWLPAEAFLFLTAIAIGGYRASLNAMTDLAERKKETLIEVLCR